MTLTVMIMCYMFLSLFFPLFCEFLARPCRCSFFTLTLSPSVSSPSFILCDCCRYIAGQFDVHAHFLRAKTELAFCQQQQKKQWTERKNKIHFAGEERAARTSTTMASKYKQKCSENTSNNVMLSARRAKCRHHQRNANSTNIHFFRVQTNAVHCNIVVMHFEHFINLFTCRRGRGWWWRGDGARSACWLWRNWTKINEYLFTMRKLFPCDCDFCLAVARAIQIVWILLPLFRGQHISRSMKSHDTENFSTPITDASDFLPVHGTFMHHFDIDARM